MPNRHYTNSTAYRYGFNGKEMDEETETQDYGMRIYNPALGKFLSVDPLTKKYPWYTPYQFAGNKPIKYIDLEGGEELDPAFKEDAKNYIFGFNAQGGTGHIETITFIPLLSIPKLNKITSDDVIKLLKPLKVILDYTQLKEGNPKRPSYAEYTLANLDVASYIVPFLGVEGKAAGILLRDVEGVEATIATKGIVIESRIAKAANVITGQAINESRGYLGGSFTFENGLILEFITEQTAKDGTLSLKSFVMYPKGAVENELKNKFGQDAMKDVLKAIGDYAKEKGFTKLEIQFERAAKSSSAKPGKKVETVIDLK